jgi:hypothetical protein
LSVLLADGLNDKPVAAFRFYASNASPDAVKIQLIWLLVLIPMAAARHVSTNSSAENDPTQHMGFHSAQKCNRGPIESEFQGWSPNLLRRMPSWNQARLAGFHTHRCVYFGQSGSSQILWPTAHTSIGIQIRAVH